MLLSNFEKSSAKRKNILVYSALHVLNYFPPSPQSKISSSPSPIHPEKIYMTHNRKSKDYLFVKNGKTNDDKQKRKFHCFTSIL